MLKTLTQSFIQSPNKIQFEGEDRDEEVLYVFRQSVIVNLGWTLVSIGLFAAPIFINTFLFDLSKENPGAIGFGFIFTVNTFWYLFSFGFTFERFLNWFFNVYIITNKRIVDMDFNNILHKKISEAPLRNIEDITYDTKGSLQTIFDYGNVHIQTAAETREFEFENVAKPGKIQDILSDLVSNVKGTYGR